MTDLHLWKLTFDLRALWQAVRHDGKQLHDADLGYAVHAVLHDLYTPARAPKPFAIQQPQRGELTVQVLAYAPEPGWQATGDALVAAQSQPVPGPGVLASGRRLAFEVSVRPTVRCHKTAAEGKERDLELDAYQSEVAAKGADAARSRELVYGDWLVRQFDNLGGARMSTDADGHLQLRMKGWQLAPVYRKGQAVVGKDGARRGTRLMTLPEASFEGELEVTDALAFQALLARGIGRHRAFGHGMLLVRRAG